MEMIERYIYAVTQKLPQSQRSDIADELRTLIEDMLEERSYGRDVTDKDIEGVLLELGNPKKLARNYRGTKNYIIGPDLFDVFILVLKISLISFAIGMGMVFVVQISIDPLDILDHFVGLIVGCVTIIPQIIGWVVIGFAIAEYAGGKITEDILQEESWKPADLAAIPDPRQKGMIKRGEPITGIVIYTVLFMVLALNNEYFGVWYFRGSDVPGVVPFLNTETYGTYLLFIAVIFGFGIIKECLKLIYGKWTVKLVTYSAIFNIVSLLIIATMIAGPEFWNPEFMDQLVQKQFFAAGSDAYQTVSIIWEQSTKWILILMGVGLIWDVADGIIKIRKK